MTAKNILDQLGSGRLVSMLGAYNFVDIGDGISFRIKNPSANYIKIVLNPLDLYDVEVGRIRGGMYKVVSTTENIYADQLKPFIEKATGMRLSFAKGGETEYAKSGKITGEFKPARYAKNKIAYFPPKSNDGFKNREMILAEAEGVRGKWSRRESAYIMSKGQAETLKRYLKEGKNANFYTHKISEDETEQEYLLGDKYSENFDYEGMLKMGLKADISWGAKKLRKLFDSFEDVNYHRVAKNLLLCIRSLEDGEKKQAEQYLDKFQDDVINQLVDEEETVEYRVEENQYIPYGKGLGTTYYYVVDSEGNTINKQTGKTYKGNQMDFYKFSTKEKAQAYADKLNSGNMEYADGGGIQAYSESEIRGIQAFTAMLRGDSESLANNPNWTNEKLSESYAEFVQLKKDFEAGLVKPSKIIGTGYKSNHSRRLAKEWIENQLAIYKRALEIRGIMKRGGKIRVRFVDKVEAIADRLEGTKVPKRLKKDYGARYSREEAEQAARRIAGAQLRDKKVR